MNKSMRHTKSKKEGRVYTPDSVVMEMLEGIDEIEEMAVCDPSCGNGQFLVQVAKTMAEKGKMSSLKRLTGFDIDEDALMQCRSRLDEVADAFGISVNWNLHHIDAINKCSWKQFRGHFDCVIGNPPYVRIQHLERCRREAISTGKWRLMKGCTDLFILFFEMGLELLKDKGKLSFITPNSWLRSQAGRPLRECLHKHHQVICIKDYRSHQVFDDVTTYSAITYIQKKDIPKNHKTKNIPSFRVEKGRLVKGEIDTSSYQWNVLTREESRRIQNDELQLKDVANINVGIQTLADAIFILHDADADFEDEITRPIIKASKMKNGKDAVSRVVIYPYRNGRLISENEMAGRFPKTYEYLLKHKTRLLSRDKGTFPKSKWWGYGREVSITSGFGDKILTSSMNRHPNFQRCPDADSLFYGGYCIKPKGEMTMLELLKQLNSERMAEFIRLFSKPYRNGWYSYSKSVIQSFPIKGGKCLI